MFGQSKKNPATDRLSVQVHAVADTETFDLAQRIWNENSRTLHTDPSTQKEFLRFGYATPKCAVWLQRDQNRTNPFELIVRWEETGMHEICVISDTGNARSGDPTRAKAILNSMLTTPSVVLGSPNY